MQQTVQLRKLLPVLRNVYNSFGDKFNSDLIQVVFLLACEQPWYKLLKLENTFSKGGPSPESKDVQKMLHMSMYSLASYLNKKSDVEKCMHLDATDIPYYCGNSSVGNPACFLAIDHEHQEIVVSIRGTANYLDALRDLVIQPSKFDCGLVHSGMRQEADEVVTKVKPMIDTIKSQFPAYSVVFTGHSLGAGAASIATLILQDAYPEIKAYCYACPSCISSELLPRLEDRVVSVINMHDLVPRMNSSSMHQLQKQIEDVNWSDLMEGLFSYLEEMNGKGSMDRLLKMTLDFGKKIEDSSSLSDYLKSAVNSLLPIREDTFMGSAVLPDSIQFLIQPSPDASSLMKIAPSVSNRFPQKYHPRVSNRFPQKYRPSVSNRFPQKYHPKISPDAIPWGEQNAILRGRAIQKQEILREKQKTIRKQGRVPKNRPARLQSYGSCQVLNEKAMSTIIDDYNRMNTSLSLLINASSLYVTYHSNQKKMMKEYKKEVNTIIDGYMKNIQDRVDSDIRKKAELVKQIQGTMRTINGSGSYLDSMREMNKSIRAEEVSGEELERFIELQSQNIMKSLDGCLINLNESLKKNVSEFHSMLSSMDTPLLPYIHSAAGDSFTFPLHSGKSIMINKSDSVGDTIRKICDSFSGERNESKDWFPYPDLYPPGKLYHLRNNPYSDSVDEMEMIQKAYSILTRTQESPLQNQEKRHTDLVSVNRIEFTKYSLEESLVQDHRMHNYIIGLSDYYDYCRQL